MKRANVTLRKKAIRNGKYSLFLDFYPPVFNPNTGKYSRREFLKLYLYAKPKSFTEKMSNSESLKTAEMICIRRQNEVNKDFIYTPFELEQIRIRAIGKKSFISYFKKQASKRIGNNEEIWNTAIWHFENFLKGSDLLFSGLSISLVDDYRDYLLTAKSRRTGKPLSRNTGLSYLNKLKTTLKKAYKEQLLQSDINAGIEGIKEQESNRNFLTLEEVKSLINTPCPKEIVMRVSLLSVLTGLRYSDIEKLKWREIQFTKNDGYYIRFSQKKTEKNENMPISLEAYEILGSRGMADHKVFPGLKKWDFDRVVPIWVAKAGIVKHITFHCFRHTYATLQIAGGTDILTVSKMLGHKSIKTTQIYTKVVDQRKRDATKRISLK